MNTQDVEQMLKDMRDGKSDEFDLVINRDKRELGKTISAEALDELNFAAETFIRARIMHHWEAKPKGLDDVGPFNIKVSMKVTIDDESYRPEPEDRPWFIIDGSRRSTDA